MDKDGELEYIKVVERLIKKYDSKSERPDRTGIGTVSEFGVHITYNLSGNVLPLFRCEFTPFKTILKELLWFISGDTNNQTLRQQGVKIWDSNGSKHFLEKRGLNYKEGDLGPIYGFQWRHYGAEYKGADHCYKGKGKDQLQECIHALKTDPFSRRNIITTWNPEQIDQMALPPCHVMYQVYVDEKNCLSGLLFQRSADLGLGVPFNVASYSILTHLLAHLTGRKAQSFIHFMGDAHLYLDHIEPLRKLDKNAVQTIPCATLKIADRVTSIDDLRLNDFHVEGYGHKGKIYLPMAV